MWRILAVVILSFLLFNSSLVFAAEGEEDNDHNHTEETISKEEGKTLNDGHEEDSVQHEVNRRKTGVDQSGQSHDVDSHSTVEVDHGTQGGHGPEEITESGPNYGILSTFGIINLTFILIGIANKFFRKRGNKNVFAK